MRVDSFWFASPIRGRHSCAQDLERVFDAFYTTKAQGLGVGLSVCRGIISAHGGRLWAANNEGPGPRFSFFTSSDMMPFRTLNGMAQRPPYALVKRPGVSLSPHTEDSAFARMWALIDDCGALIAATAERFPLRRGCFMRNMKSLIRAIAVCILGLGALQSSSAAAQDVIAVADGINMWDGQWHFDATVYAWVPFIYVTTQLPPIAGGGNPTTEIQPSQYLKHVEGGALFEGTIRKGDWNLWTDFVFLNLNASPTHTREIGLPGGDPKLSVDRSLDLSLRAAIWTLAPAYTVMNNDIGTLDVMVGLRYTSFRVSIAYEFTAPPTKLMVGGGFWPTRESTDGLIGIKGSLRLSRDGKWYLPYEADVGDGDKNWQYNAILGVGYHFRWGDIALAVRNLTYQTTGSQFIEKVRFTGPVFGATFRW